MGNSKLLLRTVKEDVEKIRNKMHESVDSLCDNLKSEDKDQVHRGLEELENSIDEASLEILFDHWENNDQESAPLLPEQQQELRNRVRGRALPGHEDAGFPGQKQGQEQDSEPEGSHNESPGAQKPGESFWEWVLRLFQEMLSRLQKKWQDLLAWLQKKWASFVPYVQSIWNAIEDFCSSVAQYFSS